jgi:hypothetical protein
MRFAIIEIHTGKICHKITSDADLADQIECDGGSSSERRYRLIPDGADENFLKAVLDEESGIYTAVEEDTTTKTAYNWTALRTERDKRILACNWIIERHRDQVAASETTSITNEQYLAWLSYRQDLRNVPQVTEDPTNPTWPTQP